MMEETPQAVLYAIGSETVLEESVAHVANDLKIPIYGNGANTIVIGEFLEKIITPLFCFFMGLEQVALIGGLTQIILPTMALGYMQLI